MKFLHQVETIIPTTKQSETSCTERDGVQKSQEVSPSVLLQPPSYELRPRSCEGMHPHSCAREAMRLPHLQESVLPQPLSFTINHAPTSLGVEWNNLSSDAEGLSPPLGASGCIVNFTTALHRDPPTREIVLLNSPCLTPYKKPRLATCLSPSPLRDKALSPLEILTRVRRPLTGVLQLWCLGTSGLG